MKTELFLSLLKTMRPPRLANKVKLLLRGRFPLAVAMAAGLTPICLGQRAATEEAAWAAFTQSTKPEATVRYIPTGTENQELDIFSPPAAQKSGKPRPVLILVHGGGWSGGSRDALAPHARYFAARGWVCVNISYRLTSVPGITLAEAQQDVRAAFDWVRSEAGKRGWDPNRISALGESAGGQLACALGVLPPEPKRWRAHSLVLVNPVLDLTTLNWALNTPGLREAGPVDPATAAQHPAGLVSPIFHLTREAPPILLLHGRKDVSVPIAQAEAFAARAKSVGAVVELVVLENSAHAFLLREYGNPVDMRAALQRIAQFLGEP